MELRPSHLLAGGLIAIHALALWAVWASLHGWPLALACAALLASLGASLREALLRSGRQTVSLELREDGEAAWTSRKGARHEGRLGKAHFVSEFLIVIELESPGRQAKRLVLLADSAVPDDLRRLRAWLRWRRGEGPK